MLRLHFGNHLERLSERLVEQLGARVGARQGVEPAARDGGGHPREVDLGRVVGGQRQAGGGQDRAHPLAQAAAAAQESARALRQHQAFLSRLTLAAQGVGPDGKKKAGTRSLEDLAADLVGSLADDLAKHSKEMHHEDKHRWIMRILAFKEADARLQAALAKAGAFLASSERTEALGTHGGSSDGAEEPKPQDDLDADGIRGLASGILAALDAEKRVDE